MMKRHAALILVIACICLPAAVAAVEAVRYFVANRPTHTIVSSGLTRDYVLHVPSGYDNSQPTPLVISLHGAGLWGAAQQQISQWNRIADREGFIVVYPSGRSGDGPRVWMVDRADTMVDVRFISDLIDSLQKTLNVDPARIFANGLSNGGGLSFVLSCTLPDRIAAVGLVASAQMVESSSCTDNRPVPMIAFHGTDDPDTPYHGGRSWVLPSGRAFPSIPRWTADWARRNQCASTPTESRIADDVTRTEYTQCADNAAAILYTIEGGGHTWPGGGALPEWFVGTTTRSIDASSVMWEFFLNHPLHTQAPQALRHLRH
jgi:polyhydroxybutyrate depolymerase